LHRGGDGHTLFALAPDPDTAPGAAGAHINEVIVDTHPKQ
jgi:hypothetical protein